MISGTDASSSVDQKWKSLFFTSRFFLIVTHFRGWCHIPLIIQIENPVRECKENRQRRNMWNYPNEDWMESLLSFLAFALCQFAGLHTRCLCIFYSLNFPDTGNLTSQMWPLRSPKGHSLATSHLLSTREKGDTYFLLVWFKKKKRRFLETLGLRPLPMGGDAVTSLITELGEGTSLCGWVPLHLFLQELTHCSEHPTWEQQGCSWSGRVCLILGFDIKKPIIPAHLSPIL